MKTHPYVHGGLAADGSSIGCLACGEPLAHPCHETPYGLPVGIDDPGQSVESPKDLPHIADKLIPIAMRIRKLADGRFGFPGAVAYELLEGPHKGKLLLAPPLTGGPHANPANKEGASSYPYRLVIQDLARYTALRDAGYLHHPDHTGAGPAVDLRPAPQA